MKFICSALLALFASASFLAASPVPDRSRPDILVPRLDDAIIPKDGLGNALDGRAFDVTKVLDSELDKAFDTHADDKPNFAQPAWRGHWSPIYSFETGSRLFFIKISTQKTANRYSAHAEMFDSRNNLVAGKYADFPEGASAPTKEQVLAGLAGRMS